MKRLFWLFLQIFWNVSHSKKNWARYDQKVYWSSYQIPAIFARC